MLSVLEGQDREAHARAARALTVAANAHRMNSAQAQRAAVLAQARMQVAGKVREALQEARQRSGRCVRCGEPAVGSLCDDCRDDMAH